jgi:hypothetical protein
VFNDLARQKLTLFWSKTKRIMSVCNMYSNVLKRDFSQFREYDSYLRNSARTSLNAQFPSTWMATPRFPGFLLNLVSANYIYFRWLSVQCKQTQEK